MKAFQLQLCDRSYLYIDTDKQNEVDRVWKEMTGLQRDYEPEQKYGTPADFQEHTRFGGTREDY